MDTEVELKSAERILTEIVGLRKKVVRGPHHRQ